MSMPIQRQSEAFGIFDDGPRYARDKGSHDLPKGLAALINTSGPRITGGLLNTRTASCEYCGEPGHDWQIHPEAHRDVADWEREKNRMEFPFGDYHEARLAINFGPGPRDHGGAGPDGGPAVPPEFYHDDEYEDMLADADERSLDQHDPDRYIPERFVEGRRGSGRLPFDRTAGHGPVPWEETDEGWHNPGTGVKILPADDAPGNWQMWAPAVSRAGRNPYSKLKQHSDPQVLMDWHDYQQGGPAPSWHERPRRVWDNIFPPSQIGPREAAALADPALQMPAGGGFQPAHRVGLDWRDRTVPGTVIGVDPRQVHVRWDDGQYTSEEPHEVHLL